MLSILKFLMKISQPQDIVSKSSLSAFKDSCWWDKHLKHCIWTDLSYSLCKWEIRKSFLRRLYYLLKHKQTAIPAFCYSLTDILKLSGFLDSLPKNCICQRKYQRWLIFHSETKIYIIKICETWHVKHHRPFYRYGRHFDFYCYNLLLWDAQGANTY